MGYVPVKGGGTAIAEAEQLLNILRTRGALSGEMPIDLDQIQHQLHFMHSQVLSEGGLYDLQLASLALKQSLGDVLEAAFFLRAFKATRPRLGETPILDTSKMRLIRRISSAFKEIPGGQILGPTPDYTHRLLNFEQINESPEAFRAILSDWLDGMETDPQLDCLPKVVDFLRAQGLVEEPAVPRAGGGADEEPYDITRMPIVFPMPRSGALTMLARGHRGSLLALAYSNMRGYGSVHPTVAELRVGYLPVEMPHPVTGELVEVGEVLITECELLTSSRGSKGGPPKFGLGYGICFGHNEVKAISMAILERAIRGGRREGASPSEDPEFVLSHVDGLESFGFCIHYKMPHYVTFQSSLNQLRVRQDEHQRKNPGGKTQEVTP